MTPEARLPLLVLASSLVAGLATFFVPEGRPALRTAFNVGAAVVKLAFVGAIAWGLQRGHRYEVRFQFVPGADLVLRADAFGLLFVTLSATLWLAATVYAVGYLEKSQQRSRFFGFFSLCVASTMGIALAGNLLTFFLFYEILTLTTYPLVIHRGTPEALYAGDVYLRYTVTGGAVFLAGIAALHAAAGPLEFTEGGALSGVDAPRSALVVAFGLLVTGLGVKAAIFPLHGWLPAAMVAPAPVSALLHAVAVVKAGAFGITRVVYEVYGVRIAHDLGVTRPLALAAATTILFGSVAALAQRDLKRRLAYSTVSQISYIVLGVAVFGTTTTVGGIVHIVHQALMKITLFFCAGNLGAALGIHDVRGLRGVGPRMPWTMAAFTIGALGMIGIPPVAGWVTKWYLGTGVIDAGEPWWIAVLLVSSLLNAAYFLPMLRDAWFREAPTPLPERAGRAELKLTLLVPTVATAALALAAGVFAETDVSPLAWARQVALREFAP